MVCRINRIEPFKAGKLAAIFYCIFGLVTTPFALLGFGNGATADAAIPIGTVVTLIVVLPLIYAIVAFISIPIVCWLYNQIAARFGGIEISIVNIDNGSAIQETEK